MIRVEAKTPLTKKNIAKWYEVWKRDLQRLKDMKALYRNKTESGTQLLKMPYAKKLVMTAAAATIGNGVKLSAPDDMDDEQMDTFKEVERLFKVQTILSEDATIIKDGCIFGRGYELTYMSSDKEPVPKCKKIDATNAFVVFDDTVENNSLYGVYFDAEKGTDGQEIITFYAYDAKNTYTVAIKAADTGSAALSDEPLTGGVPHNLGRVPLTEYWNNEEEQGDFEQVDALIRDRTDVHNLNIKDLKDIAKNYLKARNIELAGNTPEEKEKTRDKAAKTQILEVKSDDGDPNSDINILSKNENYSSVDVFGRDIDSKIYDLSMIPNLADDQFAGNQSGVALELKLMTFKYLVEAKDPFIERLYRRRLKMYVTALVERKFASFDAAGITITVSRSWTKNITELAQLIITLQQTGLFSDEYLTERMPEVKYEDQQTQLEAEAKKKAQSPDPNNANIAEMAALLRGKVDAEPSDAEK